MQTQIHGKSIELVQGDITSQCVDAIVNAANSRLSGGAGVDGAIHNRGGPAIMEETRVRYPDGCPTGSAVASGGGDLPARYVFHAVGPIWHGGFDHEEKLLASAHRACLQLAERHQCRTIAFPALSTGAYGYPMQAASMAALSTVMEHLQHHDLPETVRFVLFDAAGRQTFEETLRNLKESQ